MGCLGEEGRAASFQLQGRASFITALQGDQPCCVTGTGKEKFVFGATDRALRPHRRRLDKLRLDRKSTALRSWADPLCSTLTGAIHVVRRSCLCSSIRTDISAAMQPHKVHPAFLPFVNVPFELLCPSPPTSP